nr:uncharacterized protein LOC111099663 isoform X2 [Crassostrea virginica]XP_022286744.1 uncharacterized protein LOC111099663 isoform X2 [Crassostrea virginica]XP_022286745.1 uncharacterized protein LOC111099663 isoform X2 [Crassostrea virginica]XP_022286746.1 uncharacterized protein LOC111099663 isoform X2 [Crassostrea virginica]
MFSPVATFLLFLAVKIGLDHHQYSRKDICHKAKETLSIVDNCPNNEDTLHERSRKKMCHILPKCNGEKLFYHCVIQYSYKEIIEVCAPVGIITGKCCALFDIGVGRVIEDYRRPCTECPFIYKSNMSFLYPTCVESLKSKDFILSTTVTNVASSKTSWSSTQNTGYLDDSAMNEKGTRKQSRRKIYYTSPEDEKDHFPWFLYVIFAILFAVIVVGACIYKCIICIDKSAVKDDSCQETHSPDEYATGHSSVRGVGSIKTAGDISKRIKPTVPSF